MNTRANQLVVQLRRSLGMLPGAMSAAIYESRTWTLITIVAATDDQCYTLAMLLGLGAPNERRVANSAGGYQRWLYATAERTERGRGIVKLDVVGPRQSEGAQEPIPAR